MIVGTGSVAVLFLPDLASRVVSVSEPYVYKHTSYSHEGSSCRIGQITLVGLEFHVDAVQQRDWSWARLAVPEGHAEYTEYTVFFHSAVFIPLAVQLKV